MKIKKLKKIKKKLTNDFKLDILLMQPKKEVAKIRNDL